MSVAESTYPTSWESNIRRHRLDMRLRIEHLALSIEHSETVSDYEPGIETKRLGDALPPICLLRAKLARFLVLTLRCRV